MKFRNYLLPWAIILTSSLSMLYTCTDAQSTRYESKEPFKDEDILIVYLSRTNNTKAIAEMIQNYTGGSLMELELKNPYPEDYKAIVEQVDRENETGYLPPLATSIENIDQYEIVFLGFPTWDMQMPPPMKSFLNHYDLGGKTVIPFNTNAGYGVGSGFETVKDLCSGCHILEGYSTKGGIERDGIYYVMEGEKRRDVQMEVEKWLEKVNVDQKK